VDAHAVAADALEWLRGQPPWIAICTIGAVAGLEYLAPPVPGDTVVIAGGVLVAQRILSAPVVLIVVTIGSCGGALGAFAIGRLAAAHTRVRRILFRFIPEQRFDAAAAKYRRWGRWFILMNRFFPGVRASFLFAAGFFGVPLREVAILSALSALAWSSLLIGAGVWLGANIDDVIDLVARYSAFAWTALILIVGAVLARLIVARVRTKPDAGSS
jgi:membrane protein DedA with SNARE-associated domain